MQHQEDLCMSSMFNHHKSSAVKRLELRFVKQHFKTQRLPWNKNPLLICTFDCIISKPTYAVQWKP